MAFGRGKLALAVAVTMLFFVSALPAAEQDQAGKRIAVVNVSRVFSAYAKVKTIEDTMKKMFEAEKNALAAEEKDLKNRQDLLQLDSGDPNTNLQLFQEIQRLELDKRKFALKVKDLTTRLEARKRDEMKAVLNEIKQAIRAVGVAEGFDLVLRAPEFDDEFDPSKPNADKQDEATSAAELVRKFRDNPVLYFASNVDVTEKVIKKLNDDYRAAGAATAVPAASATGK